MTPKVLMHCKIKQPTNQLDVPKYVHLETEEFMVWYEKKIFFGVYLL